MHLTPSPPSLFEIRSFLLRYMKDRILLNHRRGGGVALRTLYSLFSSSLVKACFVIINVELFISVLSFSVVYIVKKPCITEQRGFVLDVSIFTTCVSALFPQRPQTAALEADSSPLFSFMSVLCLPVQRPRQHNMGLLLPKTTE